MNPQFKKIIAAFLLLFAIVSQSQNFQLLQYSINDGLPQSKVNDVIQDDLGYLWIATDGGGIARFDGNQFKVFNEEDGLISNYTTSLSLIDSRLFIGTKKGLSIKEADEMFSYKSSGVSKIILVGNQVYLGTNSGLRYFENLGIKLKSINNNIDSRPINDFLFDGKSLWIANDFGLWRIDDFENNTPKVLQLNEFNIIGLADCNSDIYFATKNEGVFKIDKATHQIKKNSSIKNATSITLSKDKNLLYIASNAEGITTINLKTNSVTKSLDELNNININSIFIDQQSNQWVASSTGLYKLSKSSFRHYLANQTITAVHSKKDTVFIATADGSLFFTDSIGVTKTPEFHHNIYALQSKKQGQLFAGTDDGILVLDSLKVIDTIPFVKDVQKVILKDSVFWVTSTTQGISKFQYDFKSRKITDSIQFKKSDGLYELSINDAQLDSLNRLWYISSKGYLGFIKDDVVHHLGNKLSNNATIGSLVIHKNHIYLGTHGEGIWWSTLSEKPEFKLLRGKKGLPNKNVYQLGFDSQNNLWAGLQNGVAQMLLDENTAITELHYFDKYDGFRGGEAMQNILEFDTNGGVYFGTIQGLTKYEPAGKTVDSIKPTIHFERVEVAYKKLDSVGEKEFDFSPTDNHLSFDFKTIDINHPNEIVYRWRMNTEDWNEWSKNTSVVFASLEAGNYSFEAQSKTANQLLSDPIKFQFFIETAMVKTLWFRLTVIAGVLLILFLLVWNYLKNLKRKNKDKQTQLELENDLLTLEQKALRLQMNPHFIFNVLNGIKALGMTDVKKMNTTIQKFAGLMRATLQNSRQENITLNEEIKSLNYYLDLEQLMGSKEFKYDITVDDKIDIEEVLLAPMIIQPFVENAIEHGILKIEKLGEITISFALKNNQLECRIRDNGVGYQQSLTQKKQSSHQSVALAVTKERIDMISDNSAFKIEELKDSKGKILGTLVSFNLPLITDF